MISRRLVLGMMIAFMLVLGIGTANAQKIPSGYLLSDTKADFPEKWELFGGRSYENGISDSGSAQLWGGRRENPNEPASYKNKVLVIANVTIDVTNSPNEANTQVNFWARTASVNFPIGTFSGLPLGDICFRSDEPEGRGVLMFTLANVAFKVSIEGPDYELDYESSLWIHLSCL